MAFHGQFSDALIAIGKYDISGQSNEIAIREALEALDSTTFGKTNRCYLPGVAEGEINGAFIWDPLLSALPLRTLKGVDAGDSTVLTLGMQSAVGANAWLSRSCVHQLEQGGQHGELLKGSFQGHTSDVLISGFVGEDGDTPRTASGNGAEVLVGAVSATQSLYAALHCINLSADSGTPTLDIEVESDTTGFPSATSRIAFTQLTAAGSEWKSVVGAITDTYFRVKWTIAGGATNPTATFIVSFGIL